MQPTKHTTQITEIDPATITHDPSVGLSTDAAVTTNTTGTLSAKLRGLVAIFADVWDSVNHFLKVQLQAGENHVGALGGHTVNRNATFSRPADTTAYAIGDAVADNVTAGSVTILSFNNMTRVAAGSCAVVRARMRKSTATLTNASFRLHLFSATQTVSSGDNAALVLNGSVAYLGYADITCDIAHSDGATGRSDMTMLIALPSGQTVFGLVEARAAYVPGNAEAFQFTLEAAQD